MNMLSWLIIGHLIGDWLLQSDWMAQGKRTRLITAAGMTHFTVYTLVIVGILWLAGQQVLSPITLFLMGGVIFVSHWLIDATDCVSLWMRWFGQQDRPLMRIMVDQTFHSIVLGLVVILFFESVI